MSETPTEQTTEPQEQTQGEPVDAPLGEGGEKALKAEREARKELEKQLREATSRLSEIERANESALEKAQREAREAQEAAAKATADALRFRVAAEAGITENVDLILTAPDEDTMRRQAELWTANRASTSSPATPKPDLSQGGSGGKAEGSKGDIFADLITPHFTR